MQDEIIDAVLARGIHEDACRRYRLVAWLVRKESSGFVARLLTGTRCLPYRLVADTLSELRTMLPPSLVRWDPQPEDPPEVIEIWFSK